MTTSLVSSSPAVIEVFSRPQRLSVRQRKRWMEILLSWEAKNTYVVHDETGSPVMNVQEQGRGFLNLVKRLLLGPLRPFESVVDDVARQRMLLQLRRPFRFYFHRLEVRGPDGQPLGAVQRKWTWLRRKFIIEDAQGREVATLFGPILRPWTFQIQLPGSEAEVGLLQKKWSGLGKEMFTDADNFSLDLQGVGDPSIRALLFAATVLVDVVHFERAK
jgi:uncharacterized protein YxjI